MNEQDINSVIEKASRILLTYQNKVCKEYKWVESSSSRWEVYSIPHTFPDTINYTVLGSESISKVKCVEAIESYNEKNPDNKVMVDSKRYESIMQSLRSSSSRNLTMKQYHTPYLSHSLDVCRDLVGAYKQEFKRVHQHVLDVLLDSSHHEHYNQLMESVANIDEERLASIEFCEKDRQELLDEKFDQLSQQLLLESEKEFKKKTDKLLGNKTESVPNKHSEVISKDEKVIPLILLGAAIGSLLTLLIF